MPSDVAWLAHLLAARSRALARVAGERDDMRALVVRAARLERVGWTVHKLRAQGDEPVRPSTIIATAEGDHDHD